MALMITKLCSACDACLSECPNQAITAGKPYVIDPNKCTECAGFFDTQQCMDMCPVKGAIVPAPVNVMRNQPMRTALWP